MKRKVTFNKSGSGSLTARIIIPPVFLELMNIDENDRDIDISFENGCLVIKKID